MSNTQNGWKYENFQTSAHFFFYCIAQNFTLVIEKCILVSSDVLYSTKTLPFQCQQDHCWASEGRYSQHCPRVCSRSNHDKLSIFSSPIIQYTRPKRNIFISLDLFSQHFPQACSRSNHYWLQNKSFLNSEADLFIYHLKSHLYWTHKLLFKDNFLNKLTFITLT